MGDRPASFQTALDSRSRRMLRQCPLLVSLSPKTDNDAQSSNCSSSSDLPMSKFDSKDRSITLLSTHLAPPLDDCVPPLPASILQALTYHQVPHSRPSHRREFQQPFDPPSMPRNTCDYEIGNPAGHSRYAAHVDLLGSMIIEIDSALRYGNCTSD